MPLSEQNGFEHGQQGIGGTAAVVSKVTGSLTIQVLFNRLPINHLIQLQQWEAVDVFGNHGLCGLPEEGTQAISDKLNRELPLTRAVCELVVEKMKFAYPILVLVIIQ